MNELSPYERDRPAVVDVDLLMSALTERAEARRLGMSRRSHAVAVRPETARSLAPGAGPAVTAAKRLLIRIQRHFLDDLCHQVNLQLAQTRNHRVHLTTQVARLRRDLLEAEVAKVRRERA